MATSPSTDLSSLPGVRLPKLRAPIDRVRASRLLPLGLARRWLDPEFIGLCYHNVAEPIDPLTHFGYDCKRPAEFEQDLRTLSAEFGVADVAAFSETATPQPGRRGQALLSFDDGHRQWRDIVLPILQRQRMTAMMFVSSATIGNRYLLPAHCASLAIHALVTADIEEHGRRLASACVALALPPLSGLAEVCVALRAAGSHEQRPRLIQLLAQWGIDEAAYLAEAKPYLDEGQIRELVAAGCVVGAHGIDHRSLHAVPFAEVERQVLESCAVLRDISGQRVVPFAFPYSRRVAAEPLARLRQRETWVGAYFGTGGLRPAPSGFYERTVADWRFSLGPEHWPEAVLTLCRRAFLAQVAERIRRPLTGGVPA